MEDEDADSNERDTLLRGSRRGSACSAWWVQLGCLLLTCCLLVGLGGLLARTVSRARRRAPASDAGAAARAGAANASAHAEARDAPGYFAWPPALVNHSAALVAAIDFGPSSTAATVVATLVGREAARAAADLPPPVLVIAGGEWPFGLGNILTGLASAAVLAEALGAACAFSFGDRLYASELRRHIPRSRFGGQPMAAFPCVDVSVAQLRALREQTALRVVSFHDWRARGAPREATRRAFVLDFGILWHEDNCATRPDVGMLLAPPAMAPAQLWARLRSKYEEAVHVGIRVPVGAHERRVRAPSPPLVAGEGTACAHARLLHRENHKVDGRAPLCEAQDCGGVLAALEALHARRPFGSFLVTAGANCSQCLAERAPNLLRTAEQIASPHGTRRIATPGTDAALFDAAAGALADMRALSRCMLVIVDDKPSGTFALALAAAGRLAPCAEPLAWLEGRGPGYGTLAERIAGTYQLGDPTNYLVPTLRALCGTDDMSAPAAPITTLSSQQERRLADDLRYQFEPWWSPRQLPRQLSEHIGPADRRECERSVRSFVRRKREAQRRQSRATAGVGTAAHGTLTPARAG
ncbi:hypothetical protein KFE25_002989 [Diacronema lutheri]|uniref:Uncharacterized protein n=1 Tax=Diacronema lutheri TaxID=2081491 RepID=A0A8J6C8T2_DIALT|nr:hypothetical protein KFE25_002989 [Diacronema lutheri]